jgi:hypothetical protein
MVCEEAASCGRQRSLTFAGADARIASLFRFGRAWRRAAQRHVGWNMNLNRWNALLGVPHVLAFGLLWMLSAFLWTCWIGPHLFTALKPLEEGSPFLYDVLRSAAALLVVAASLLLPFIALYCYQRRWDRSHSQQGRSSEPPPRLS